MRCDAMRRDAGHPVHLGTLRIFILPTLVTDPPSFPFLEAQPAIAQALPRPNVSSTSVTQAVKTHERVFHKLLVA
jgi:hypothetical protein